MGKNVKCRPAAVRFEPAIKAALCCAFFALVGLGYVWQKTQIQHLGEQYKRVEARYELLEAQNRTLRGAVATLCTRTELDARMKRMNLGLVRPQPDQIVRLREFAAEPSASPDLRTAPGLRETTQMYATRR
jgi:hypothetical protein